MKSSFSQLYIQYISETLSIETLQSKLSINCTNFLWNIIWCNSLSLSLSKIVYLQIDYGEKFLWPTVWQLIKSTCTFNHLSYIYIYWVIWLVKIVYNIDGFMNRHMMDWRRFLITGNFIPNKSIITFFKRQCLALNRFWVIYSNSLYGDL